MNKHILIILQFLFITTAYSADLGMNKREFIESYKERVNSLVLDSATKTKMEDLHFEIKGDKKAEFAKVFDSTIVLGDQDGNGVLNTVGVIFPAPKGGLSEEAVAIRMSVIAAVIGYKNSHSKPVEYVKSTTGTRKEKRRTRIVDGFVVQSSVISDGVQAIGIINDSNKNPNKARESKKPSKTDKGIDYGF